MGNEMSKASLRRKDSEMFVGRYFWGRGLDIGCGSDPLQPSSDFPNIQEVVGYDTVLGHKDAQYLEEVKNNCFDFVVSSHCLEHMIDPVTSVINWLRVLKVGGHLIVTVPEYDMYEHRHWPSKFNGDHKWSWTCNIEDGLPKHVIFVPAFVKQFEGNGTIKVVSVTTIVDNYDPDLANTIDQTGGPAECAIEFILNKIG